jgi:N-methylhydantoinase B
VLAAGEAIRLETCGGGGFGPPSERAIEELAKDLRDEVLSLDKARRDYGDERVATAMRLVQASLSE